MGCFLNVCISDVCRLIFALLARLDQRARWPGLLVVTLSALARAHNLYEDISLSTTQSYRVGDITVWLGWYEVVGTRNSTFANILNALKSVLKRIVCSQKIGRLFCKL